MCQGHQIDNNKYIFNPTVSQTLDPPMRAMPTLSLRFCPPDSVLACAFLLVSRPTSLAMAATDAAVSFLGQPFIWQHNAETLVLQYKHTV